MNQTRQLVAGKIGVVLCTAVFGALTGCTTYVEQPRPREVYVPPPVYVEPASVQVRASFGSVGVVIRSEDDFYEPLSPYGRWEVVGSYGRCWIPGRIEAGWRPYCNGNWQRTDAGWYWASDEPWAWATYHYGRWDFSARFGWYWVPQTQWAPAWVSWHEGGGYVGWAPLHPSARISASGSVAFNIALIAPRAFVFVEPRRFLQPVRPTTVVVNNTTIINQTVNITNIKVVNNTVINEGPRTQIIEQASGQKVQAVPVRELRRKQEAEVVARQGTTSPGREKKEKDVQTPVRSEAAPRETESQPESQQRAKESAAKAQEQLQRNGKDVERAAQVESQRRANEAATKVQGEARSKAKGAETKAQADSQRSAKEMERMARLESQQRGKESEKKAQGKPELRPKHEQIASEPGGTNTVKKAQKKKGKGKPPPPEDPPVTPPASP